MAWMERSPTYDEAARAYGPGLVRYGAMGLGEMPSDDVKKRLTRDVAGAEAVVAEGDTFRARMMRDALEGEIGSYDSWPAPWSTTWSGYDGSRELLARLRDVHAKILYQEGRSIAPEAPMSRAAYAAEVGKEYLPAVVERAGEIPGEARAAVQGAVGRVGKWVEGEAEKAKGTAVKVAVGFGIAGVLSAAVYGWMQRGRR